MIELCLLCLIFKVLCRISQRRSLSYIITFYLSTLFSNFFEVFYLLFRVAITCVTTFYMIHHRDCFVNMFFQLFYRILSNRP